MFTVSYKQPTRVKFSLLSRGQAFMWGGSLYIKSEIGSYHNSIWLCSKTGESDWRDFDYNVLVTCVTIKSVEAEY